MPLESFTRVVWDDSFRKMTLRLLSSIFQSEWKVDNMSEAPDIMVYNKGKSVPPFAVPLAETSLNPNYPISFRYNSFEGRGENISFSMHVTLHRIPGLKGHGDIERVIFDKDYPTSASLDAIINEMYMATKRYFKILEHRVGL